MYNKDTKEVLLTNVYKVGDKFTGDIIVKGIGSSFATFTVVDITDTEVILQVYDWKDTKNYSKDKVYVEVLISEEERAEKYKDDIIDFYNKILYPYMGEHGEHSYDNSWYSSDIIEITKNFKDMNYEFIGYFNLDSYQIIKQYSTTYDVGLIFKEEDNRGNEYRYWCHFSSKYLEDMKEQYKTFDF